MPSYRKHKPSNRAVVQWKPLFGDKPHYLRGAFGSPESLAEWASIQDRIAEMARQAPEQPKTPKHVANLAQFLAAYFIAVRDRLNRGHRSAVKQAIDIAGEKFGKFGVDDFGPVALEECRDAMVERGWSRKYVNRQVGRIRHAFKWGVARQLVRPETFGALILLEGLKKGWTKAPERKRVRPASRAAVDRLMPFLSSQIADMLELQWLCGMRSDELTGMKDSEIGRDALPWEYRPGRHKNTWRDDNRDRVIFFGPKSRKILGRYKGRSGYIFRPAESLKESLLNSRDRLTADGRKKKKAAPRVRSDVRDRYDAASYQRAIIYGFIRLGLSLGKKKRPTKGETIRDWLPKGVEYFHPHQLRHARGTETRKKFGVQGARAQLQNTFDATLIYAEEDEALAKKIAAKTG